MVPDGTYVLPCGEKVILGGRGGDTGGGGGLAKAAPGEGISKHRLPDWSYLPSQLTEEPGLQIISHFHRALRSVMISGKHSDFPKWALFCPVLSRGWGVGLPEKMKEVSLRGKRQTVGGRPGRDLPLPPGWSWTSL